MHEKKNCPEDKNNARVLNVTKKGRKLVTIWKCNTCGKTFERPTQG